MAIFLDYKFKMSEVDELYEVKNNYYLGNYQTAVNEANKLKLCK